MNKPTYFFCKYCPCVWCDGNKNNNKEITGYEFIPDLDHCKKMFEQEDDLSYNTFVKAVFELYGSSVNKDWHRFLIKSEEDLSN